MPIGPKGQKRPRDPNQLAKLIVDIGTGQVDDGEPMPNHDTSKAKEAAHRSRRGDRGRLKKETPE
jgi:hypothetical protein